MDIHEKITARLATCEKLRGQLDVLARQVIDGHGSYQQELPDAMNRLLGHVGPAEVGPEIVQTLREYLELSVRILQKAQTCPFPALFILAAEGALLSATADDTNNFC